MAEQPHIDLQPSSLLWNNIGNLSGHAVVAMILLYLVTHTLPDLMASFQERLRQQQVGFTEVLKNQREDFTTVLMAERTERVTDRAERLQSNQQEREERKQILEAIKDLRLEIRGEWKSGKVKP